MSKVTETLNRIEQAALSVLKEHQSELFLQNGANGTELVLGNFSAPQGQVKSFVLQEIAQALKVFVSPGAEIVGGGKNAVLLVRNKGLSLEGKMARNEYAFKSFVNSHGRAPTDDEFRKTDINTEVPNVVAEMVEKLETMGVTIEAAIERKWREGASR